MEEDKITSATQNITYWVIVLQALFFSMSFMVLQIFKWRIRESLTAFIYPVFKIIVICLLVASLVVSAVYAITKIQEQKRKVVVPFVIQIVIIVFTCTFFNENMLRYYNYKLYEDERTELVEAIINGDVQVDEMGNVLYDESYGLNSELFIKLIDNGEQKGVYFCTFSGLTDSSSGYFYSLDEAVKYMADYDFKIIKDFEGDWFYIGTY